MHHVEIPYIWIALHICRQWEMKKGWGYRVTRRGMRDRRKPCNHLILCQLNTRKSHLGKGSAIEKTPPPDWPTGKPVVCFLHWLIWEDLAHCGQGSSRAWLVVLGSTRKQAEEVTSPLPLHHSCLKVLVLSSLDDGLQAARENKSFLPQVDRNPT